MKWCIQTLTQPSRSSFLAGLCASLNPQLVPGVCHMIRTFDPTLSLGENRQRMREESDAEYVSVCDDDDKISDHYVQRILPLLDGVDYIGFRVQAYEDGVPLPGPTYHSLMCGSWFDKTYADGSKSWHRNISHLNPIRRELALKVPMYGGFAEDSRWAGEMSRLGIVKTEHFVDEVMYFYLSRTDKKDGVQPNPHAGSAGECKFCHSMSTVLVSQGKFCNACGVLS